MFSMKYFIMTMLLMRISSSRAIIHGHLRSHHLTNQDNEIKLHERSNPTNDTIAMRIKRSIDGTISKRKDETCDETKIIKVAVVYDSAFGEMLRTYRTPEAEIKDLFTKVSKQLQNQEDLCLRTKLTHVEGDYEIMNERKAPQDHLIDFQDWFNQNRPDVDRTVSLLFTGKMIEEKYKSISYKGQLCRPKYAFGILFTDAKKQNLKENVVSVVHQIAQMIGLEDLNYPTNRRHFTQESVAALKNILENQTCLKTESNVINKVHFDDITPEIS